MKKLIIIIITILAIILISATTGSVRSIFTNYQKDRGTSISYLNDTSEIYGWDDFAFSVNNLRINPVTSKPDYDFTRGEYLFDKDVNEGITGSNITRHEFRTGISGIFWHPHIHCAISDTGHVVWMLRYKIWSVNNQEPDYDTLYAMNPEFIWSSGVIHNIYAFDSIDVSGINSTACVVDVKIDRIANSPSDTYNHDVRFKQFDFHVQINQSRGSRKEYIK